jgi:hypothetical protein
MALKEFFAVAGCTLGASVTLPATEDAAGYQALSFTNVGSITDLGSGLGKAYNTVSSTPIDDRRVQKQKGSYDVGDLTIIVNVKDDDAGQVLLQAGVDSDSPLAFELEFNDNPDGTSNTFRFFQGLVMGDPVSMGTIDNVVTYSMTIAVTTDEVKVNAVV